MLRSINYLAFEFNIPCVLLLKAVRKSVLMELHKYGSQIITAAGKAWMLSQLIWITTHTALLAIFVC